MQMRGRHCLPTTVLREVCDYTSYTFLGFYSPITHEGWEVGEGSLFIRFNKTVTGFPDSIILCHRCHACITRSHLFLNCTAVEEFIKWTAATWFLSRPCWWWHHGASERQQSADTPCDISQTNICHKGKKFWGRAILSCFHMDEGFFGLHCWQRTK